MGNSNVLVLVLAVEYFVKNLYFEEALLRLLEDIGSRNRYPHHQSFVNRYGLIHSVHSHSTKISIKYTIASIPFGFEYVPG